MFEQMGMTEAQNVILFKGKIKVVDTSPECFKAMLEYFYSGEIDEKTLETYSKDLFAIAHKYQVKQLMDICEDYMISTIVAGNFSKLCFFAELYHLSKLRKACINFLSANKQSFLVSKEWKEFKSLNKDLAFRLLELSALKEEKQIEEKQVCPKCEQRRNSSRYSPYYQQAYSPHFAFRLLESSALKEEKQIEEKQVVNCPDCETRGSGSLYGIFKEWDEFKSFNKDLAFRLMEEIIFDRKDSSDNEEEPSRIRTVINEMQYTVLKQAFEADCYPNVRTKNELAKNLGLRAGVIGEWFKNRRAKAREESSRNSGINN
uniref:Homeobox domain-containing protein n=1 Tax=Meloidogyne javanica TaxID=6303 RepID=A0A915LRI5_MELJA